MSFLSALALSALALPALAEDGKACTGSSCQPMSFRPTAPSGLAVGGVTISNFSTSFENVACPVGKDVEAGRIKRAEVMVIDRSPVANHDISCTLATHKKDGSQPQSVMQKSNSSFQNALPLTFGAHTAAVQGSYSLICPLPPMATVAGTLTTSPTSRGPDQTVQAPASPGPSLTPIGVPATGAEGARVARRSHRHQAANERAQSNWHRGGGQQPDRPTRIA